MSRFDKQHTGPLFGQVFRLLLLILFIAHFPSHPKAERKNPQGNSVSTQCLDNALNSDSQVEEATLWMRKWEDQSADLSPEGVDVMGLYSDGHLKILKVYLYGEKTWEHIFYRLNSQSEMSIIYVHWMEDGGSTGNSIPRIDCIRVVQVTNGNPTNDCISGSLRETKAENLQRMLKIKALAAEKIGT